MKFFRSKVRSGQSGGREGKVRSAISTRRSSGQGRWKGIRFYGDLRPKDFVKPVTEEYIDYDMNVAEAGNSSPSISCRTRPPRKSACWPFVFASSNGP